MYGISPHLVQYGWMVLFAETTTHDSSPNVPWVLIGSGIAWAVAWIQVLVLQFYGKSEKLHQDYHASGRLNQALSSIEADRLIPALARMFQRALDARDDRRERPDIETLLNAVDFLPDLAKAQGAMAEIERIGARYADLKRLAGWVWKWGILHVLLSPALPTIYLSWTPDQTWASWAFVVLAFAWIITLGVSLWGFGRFHRRMTQFNEQLEGSGGRRV